MVPVELPVCQGCKAISVLEANLIRVIDRSFVGNQFAIPPQLMPEEPHGRMEKNQITAKCRQSVPDIIPPPNVDQFMPKNARELRNLQSGSEPVRQQNFGVEPAGSCRRAEARDQSQFTPRRLNFGTD